MDQKANEMVGIGRETKGEFVYNERMKQAETDRQTDRQTDVERHGLGLLESTDVVCIGGTGNDFPQQSITPGCGMGIAPARGLIV